MPREPIISAGPERDEEFDRSLRPQRIKDMVGQRDVIERLNIVGGQNCHPRQSGQYYYGANR